MFLIKLVGKIIGFSLAIGGGFLLCTNPGYGDYEDYATKTLITHAKKELCESNDDFTPGFLASSCNSLIDVSRPQLGIIISRQTQRQNFLLFSIYETDLVLFSPLPSYRVATLGILSNFYIYDLEEL